MVVTEITKEFTTQMGIVIAELEKLGNNRIKGYTDFFGKFIGGLTIKKGRPEISHEEITSLYGKITELLGDKAIKDIERPVDPGQIEQVFSGVQGYFEKLNRSLNIRENSDPTENLSVTDLGKIITNANSGILLASSLKTLVADRTRGYSDIVKERCSKSIEGCQRSILMINLVRDLYLKKDGNLLIPELKNKTLQNF